MKKVTLITATCLLMIVSAIAVYAGPAQGPWVKPDTEAQRIYDRLVEVVGDRSEWKLAPAERQIDTTGAHLGMSQYLGLDQTLTKYRVIARGTVFEENFMMGTDREMVTMYHCDRLNTCETIIATHYCAKRNVPTLKLNFEETGPRKFVFDCDMSTSLCQSDDDHIYKLMIEVSEDGQHMKISYLGRTNQKPNDRHSIFHFDRRN